MSRTISLFATLLAAAVLACGDSAQVDEGSAIQVQMWKSATCGCCAKWAEHLEDGGFSVAAIDVKDLSGIKRRHGVPADSEACHTAVVDGYVIEGHVPLSDIQRLLEERPDVRGLVVPGMPKGSPGMESPHPEPYSVYAFDESGGREVFSSH